MAATYPTISPGLFRAIIISGIETLRANPLPPDPPYESRFAKEELSFQLALREGTGDAIKSLSASISQQFRTRNGISAVPATSREEIKAAASQALAPAAFIEAKPESAPTDRLLTLDEMLAAALTPNPAPNPEG